MPPRSPSRLANLASKPLGGVLKVWAATNPVKALDLIARHDITHEATLARIFIEVAKGSPSQAAAWLGSHGEANGVQSQLLAITWAQQDPAPALSWAIANGVSISTPLDRSKVEGMFNNTGGSPVWAAFGKDPDATISAIDSMPLGEERTRCIEFIAPLVKDTGKLNTLLGKLPPESATAAAAAAARFLYIGDAGKGLAWVDSLSGEARRRGWMQIGVVLSFQKVDPSLLPKAGPDRDALISGEVSTRIYHKPTEALSKANEIVDPALRRETLHYAFANLLRSGNDARIREAREWLKFAPVPAEWKQNWQ
jgi:hypothetical protein